MAWCSPGTNFTGDKDMCDNVNACPYCYSENCVYLRGADCPVFEAAYERTEREGINMEDALQIERGRDRGITRFTQVGEMRTRFEVNLNHRLRHLQRIRDFLAGMGVEAHSGCFEFVWLFQMTASQKARWDKWFNALP